MDGPDNLYSQAVGWIKIVLLMGALALLSTLFLFARSPADQTEIPFAEIADLARDQRLTAPRFFGLADDGSTIAIAARNARPGPDGPDKVQIESLSLSLEGTDGSQLDITAGSSLIDGQTQVARLEGLARLTTSTGYVMETVGLTADLKSGIIASDGMLEIQAPYGEMTAGRIEIRTGPDGPGRQLLFTGGVHLIYTPPERSVED